MPMSLYDQTLKLIKNRPASIKLTDISEATNLGYSWLCMFHQGRIENPSYKKLQTLHDYLIARCKQSA